MQTDGGLKNLTWKPVVPDMASLSTACLSNVVICFMYSPHTSVSVSMVESPQSKGNKCTNIDAANLTQHWARVNIISVSKTGSATLMPNPDTFFKIWLEDDSTFCYIFRMASNYIYNILGDKKAVFPTCCSALNCNLGVQVHLSLAKTHASMPS